MSLELNSFPYLAIDSETTGLRYPLDRAFGVSMATPDGQSYYWDLREYPSIIDWLDRALSGYKGTIIAHNASFDYRMLKTAGIRMNINSLDDTVIRACCIDEHLHSYSLDALAEKYLGQRKVNDIYADLAGLFGGLATRGVQMPRLHAAPSSVVAPYARQDAVLALRLWEWQAGEVARQHVEGVPDLTSVMQFERRVMPSLIRMEVAGIRVDVAAAERAMGGLTAIINQNELELLAHVGGKININSAPQMREFFKPKKDDGGNWTVGGVVVGTTKSGAPSLGADSLRMLAAAGNPVAKLILDGRSLIKTRDTFLGGHIVGHAVDGRVYPTINQSKGEHGGTGTGRLSYQDPAMQQIPSRNKKVAAIVKPIFLPELGQDWLDVDENSFEVRVFAHLVTPYDDKIAQQYAANPHTDFHQYVADLTHLPRNASYSGQPNAKQLNLSAIFNSGNGALADKMGMSWEWDSFEDDEGEVINYRRAGLDAMEVINRYHEALPGVKKLQKKCRQTAMNRGFLFTSQGRRIRFPDKRKSYKASGLLIQSTAADYNKENIVIAEEYLRKNGGRLMLNTHDSYSMSIPAGSYADIWPGLKALLDAPGRARVPLIAEVSGVGADWWSALNNESGV
jgi:DNA polymerase I